MQKKELEELQASIYDKLAQAIKAGEKEKALALLEEINRNRNSYRDVFLTWIDILQTYGAEKMGEEFVYETDRVFGERVIWPNMFKGALELKTPEDRLRNRAYVWTSWHGGTIDSIEEDDEKFIIKLKCPSGGNVRIKSQYGKTKKAYPWSYKEPGLAYYCTHCPVTVEMMPIEKYGYPAWICQPQPEGRCIQYVFKDREATPEKFYKRVGMEKKSAAKRKSADKT